MKKFLTLILLCAAAQIAWAQTVVNTDAEIRSAVQVTKYKVPRSSATASSSSSVTVASMMPEAN